MEKKELYEVPLLKDGVSPGLCYDDKSRCFFEAHDSEHFVIKTYNYMEFDLVGRDSLEYLRKNFPLNTGSWINDYIKEKPAEALLVEGVRIVEKRGVGIPEDSKRCRVLSVLHKYHANLLLCFSGKISQYDLKMFKEHLDSRVNKTNCNVLPHPFVRAFLTGYIYPKYLGPGRRFSSIMYGVNEFCSFLQSSQVSIIPVSAIIRCPTVKYDVSVNYRHPVSDEQTCCMLESKVQVELDVATGGKSNSGNFPFINSEGRQKKDSLGHGITKMTGANNDIQIVPGVNVSRGRGTGRGKGTDNVMPLPQSQEITRYKVSDDRKKKPLAGLTSINSKVKGLAKTNSVIWFDCVSKLQKGMGEQEGSSHDRNEETLDSGMLAVDSVNRPVATSTFGSCADVHGTCKSSCSHSEVLMEQHLKSHVECSTESGGKSNLGNLSIINSEGSQSKDSMGHEMTKMTGANNDRPKVPAVNVGRGRGTVRGRGTNNVTPLPQSQESTRYKVGEDKENQSLESLTSVNSNVKELTKTNSVIDFHYENKFQKCVEEQEGRSHEPNEEIKDSGTLTVNAIDLPAATSTFGSNADILVNCKLSYSQSEILTEHHLKSHVESSTESYLDNGKKMMTTAMQTNCKFEHNDAKNPADEQMLPNANRDQIKKPETNNQKSYTPANNAIPQSQDKKSDSHTSKPNNTHHEIHPDSEKQKTQINKQEFKKETVSKQSNSAIRKTEETAKEIDLNRHSHEKDIQRKESGSQKTDNIKREIVPYKEAQKSNIKAERGNENYNHDKKYADHKNALPKGEKDNDSGKSVGRAGSILKNGEKLYQGLGLYGDKEDESFMKIGSLNISTSKARQCAKEQIQMKTKYLEATKTLNDELGFQRKYYGVINCTSLEKVILLLGASGSGKTTLVNFAANHFKKKKSADEGLYHVVTPVPTTEVIAYTFCRSNDEIPITIIDTPGLNDASGAEVRDHVQSLKTFLANTSACDFKIHAIGFVAQAHLVRLTSSERLVMDYVSTLFGQGVTDHLITLVTFADVQDKPPVLEAMRNYGIGFKLSLKFSNSALHNETDEVDDIDRIYWKICRKNWKKCLKTLIELSPLCINTMKAVQSEVFSSTVLKSIERDLTASLRAFFTYPKKERIMLKEASKICSEIWNLVAVLNHLRSANEGVHSTLEDTITEFACEVCKSQKIPAEENVYFLSLCAERPLILCGSQVICNMASIYIEAKTYHSKSGTFSKNISHWMYCQTCKKEHSMRRTEPRSSFADIFKGSSQNVVVFKCDICKCSGNVHIASRIDSPFHPDRVLAATRSSLQKVIVQHSLPNFPVPEGSYLHFLDNFLNFEYEEFIKEF